jgi:hypothetical protein
MKIVSQGKNATATVTVVSAVPGPIGLSATMASLLRTTQYRLKPRQLRRLLLLPR